MSVNIHHAATVEAMIMAGADVLSGSASARLDARVLTKMVLGCDDASLIARAADPVDDDAKDAFFELIMRRAGGEPVAYITGQKEFWGLPFRVTRDVLIPRADSECLIETLCARADITAPYRIVDLGTGSGCLLCALLHELPAAVGTGADISAGAIAIARENAEALGFADRANFVVSNWFENIKGEFDIIIVNAPYIPAGDRPELIVDVSEFEPSVALFAGDDGLDEYRRIFSEIDEFLAASGRVAVEYGNAEQGVSVRAIAAANIPNAEFTVIRDLAARERGIILRRRDGKRD